MRAVCIELVLCITLTDLMEELGLGNVDDFEGKMN